MTFAARHRHICETPTRECAGLLVAIPRVLRGVHVRHRVPFSDKHRVLLSRMGGCIPSSREPQS